MISSNQQINLPLFKEKGLRLFMKRLDLMNLPVAGNKYYKLKYNIEEAFKTGYKTLLTFGGAYSNHILATAVAGRQVGLKTVGVIRGDELVNCWQDNPTLAAAHGAGMEFRFISRSKYRNKISTDFIQNLRADYGRFYLIPEGGTNELAVRGTTEILDETDRSFNYICCCVGTGGTLAGLINSSTPTQQLLGFPALKGDFLKEDICKFTAGKNWDLINSYHFGGYAKVSRELIEFVNQFKTSSGIPLDPIYTAKMMFGIMDLTKKDYFLPGTSILAIHSGGLQGISGMNEQLKKKNLPLIRI